MVINTYNKYQKLSMIPYNIVQYLFENSEDFWKLLYYKTPDALQKQNLTTDEKASLIYKNDDNADGYRIFFQPIVEDAFTQEVPMIRIFPLKIIPRSKDLGVVNIGIEIICHNKVNYLNNYSTRILCLLEETISVLNGAVIGGTGQLFFDKSGSSEDGASFDIFNNRNFMGYTLILSLRMGG